MKLFLNKFILLLTFGLFFACGEKDTDGLEFHRPAKESFDKLVNKKQTREVNLNKDVFLNTDPEYPIELALYDDGKFYYNLPQLGEGQGNWKYEEGMISLVATRYFGILNRDVDMIYKIKSLNSEGTKFKVFFRDRFGLKSYDLNLNNMSL